MVLEVDQSDIPLPGKDATATVAVVRDAMRAELAKGESVICPCCGGTSKVYARTIHAKMVRALIEVARTSDGLSPADLSALTAGGDAQKLAHWGLILRDVKTGLWFASTKGRYWLAGDITIPHKVITYGAQIIGFDKSKMIRVSDVRNSPVNLAEILSSWSADAAE